MTRAVIATVGLAHGSPIVAEPNTPVTALAAARQMVRVARRLSSPLKRELLALREEFDRVVIDDLANQ